MNKEFIFSMIVTRNGGHYQCNLFPADMLPIGQMTWGGDIKEIVNKSLEEFYREREQREQELAALQKKADERHMKMTELNKQLEEAIDNLKKSKKKKKGKDA